MRIPGYSMRRGEREPFILAECLPAPVGGNWSTKDEPEHNARLLAVLKERGITRAFVPHPTFNGLVVEPARIMRSRWLDDEHELIKSVLPLEGYEIPAGDALVCPAGGCPFLVGLGWTLDGRMRMIAAHAGRDSLIDRNRIAESRLLSYLELRARREDSRPFEGVAYSMVEAFRKMHIGPHRIEMHMFFSIAGTAFFHAFDHPKYGAYNRRMYEDIRGRWGERAAYKTGRRGGAYGVCVSLPDLFLGQAKELHVSEARCYPDIPEDGAYPHTHHPTVGLRDTRYLVILRNTYVAPAWARE